MRVVVLIWLLACSTCAPGGDKRAWDPLSFDDQHVGPIDSRTPYSLSEIRRLLPGTTVELFRVAESGDVANKSIETILVRFPDGGSLSITGIGGLVSSAAIGSARFEGPGGIRVGQNWHQAGFRRQDCEPISYGLPYADAISCTRPEAMNLRYRFRVPRFAYGRGSPPSIAYSEGRLETVGWSPAR